MQARDCGTGPSIRLVQDDSVHRHDDPSSWESALHETENCISFVGDGFDIDERGNDEFLEEEVEVDSAISLIQRLARKKAACKKVAHLRARKNRELRILMWAVLHLQKMFRGHCLRKRLIKFVVACVTISRAYRNYRMRTLCAGGFRRIRRPVEISFNYFNNVPQQQVTSGSIKIVVSAWTYPLLHILAGKDCESSIKLKPPNITWTSPEFQMYPEEVSGGVSESAITDNSGRAPMNTPMLALHKSRTGSNSNMDSNRSLSGDYSGDYSVTNSIRDFRGAKAKCLFHNDPFLSEPPPRPRSRSFVGSDGGAASVSTMDTNDVGGADVARKQTLGEGFELSLRQQQCILIIPGCHGNSVIRFDIIEAE